MESYAGVSDQNIIGCMSHIEDGFGFIESFRGRGIGVWLPKQSGVH